MSSFSYTTPMTNPYSSRPLSAEKALKNLTRTHGSNPASLEVVQSIQEQLIRKELKWTLNLAQDLSSYSIDNLDLYVSDKVNIIPESSVATLQLLTTAMNQWQDNVLYAVLVQESNSGYTSKNLWDLLIKLSMNQSSIQIIALLGISTASRCLERLRQMTSLNLNCADYAWWLNEENSKHLSRLALKVLISGFDETTPELSSVTSILSLPTYEKIKFAATSILSDFLKVKNASWLNDTSEEELKVLVVQLTTEAQALVSPQLPPDSSASTLSLAILSATLLSLIQWKSTSDAITFDQIIQISVLVENIVCFVYPSSQRDTYSQGPTWTWDVQFEQCQQYALDLILCWRLCDGDAWAGFVNQERFWGKFFESTWNNILSNQSIDVERILPKVYVLHVTCQLYTRTRLSLLIKKRVGNEEHLFNPPRVLTMWLLEKARDDSFHTQILATRLLWTFVSNRRSTSTHDDFSRAFWSALDTNTLGRFMNITLEYASTDDAEQPVLLTLLDILDELFHVVENCDFVLSQLGAQSLEKLIYLVEPKERKIDFCFDMDIEKNSNTPPANNLSRLDEKSIYIEQEEEKEARGLDYTVRLAAATVLSRLGYHASLPSNESLGLLISRICTGVNEFFASFHEFKLDERFKNMLSLDVSKRSYRLQHAMTTSENEAFVTSILFAKLEHHEEMLIELKQENESKDNKLFHALEKEQKLKLEKKRLINQCRAHASLFERELTKVKTNAIQDTRQLVAMHVSERSHAEKHALELQESMKESESKLKEVQQMMEEFKKAEEIAKKELHGASSKLFDLQKENKELKCMVDGEIAKVQRLEEKLMAKTEELVSTNQRQNKLEGEISLVKDNNANLRDNLEDLFADMISISQIYHHKETEETENLEKKNREFEELRRALDHERESNEEKARNLENLKQENEKLLRKYSKYKERLEVERRERQEENQRRKRNGPVSYINQLYDSQKSNKTASMYGKDTGSRSHLGKENSFYSTSGSSQRRTNFR